MGHLNYHEIDLIPVVFNYESNGGAGLLFKTLENEVHTVLSVDLVREMGIDKPPAPGCIWAKFHNSYIELVGFLVHRNYAEFTTKERVQAPYATFVELRLTGLLNVLEKL